MNATTETVPNWSLANFINSPEDPRLAQEFAALHAGAAALREGYLGKVASLSPEGLAQLLVELEGLMARLSPLEDHAFLSLNANAHDEAARALEAAVAPEAASLHEAWAFVGRELDALEASRLEALVKHPALKGYAPYLRGKAIGAAHALSPTEEAVVAWKDEQGQQAWRRLFRDLSGDLRVQVQVGDEVQGLSLAEASSLLDSEDRALRERASAGIHLGLATVGRGLAASIGAVVGDRVRSQALRGQAHPFSPVVAPDLIPPEDLEKMLDLVAEHRHLPERYARLKAKALGLPQLAWHDFPAPLPSQGRSFTWPEAQSKILSVFEAFSPRMAEVAAGFFEGQHIDAKPNPWKSNRAFCGWVAGHHPLILMSFRGQWEDLPMLAHELGHGVHYHAVHRKHGPLHMRGDAMITEVPSTFAELLLFEALTEEAQGPERLALLGRRIENALLNIFVQGGLARFELSLYRGLHGAAASPQALCEAWVAQRQAVMGDAIHFPEWTQWGWARYGSIVQQPFNSLLYPFGLLCVFALGEKWRAEGEAFVAPYFRMLDGGISAPTSELLADMGLSVSDPKIWRSGLAYLDKLLDAYEEALQSSPALP